MRKNRFLAVQKKTEEKKEEALKQMNDMKVISKTEKNVYYTYIQCMYIHILNELQCRGRKPPSPCSTKRTKRLASKENLEKFGV